MWLFLSGGRDPLGHKTNAISILQFDERHISLLRVRRAGKGIEVLASCVEPGTSPAGEEDRPIEGALRDFVKRHGLARDEVHTVLPRHDMTTRLLTLPSDDLDEIAGMVRLNVGEYVPYPLEELVVDQCILGHEGGYSRVLAAFAHRDIVEAHVALLQQAGIEPHEIYLSSACMASAAIAGLDDDQERYALVNMASGGLEVLVCKSGTVEYGRGIATPEGWDRWETEPDQVAAELASEVRASLAAQRRDSDDGGPVTAVYLASESVDVSGPAEMLARETGLPCCPASFAFHLIESGVEGLHGLPLVSLGAALTALGKAAVTISLTPESLAQVRRHAAARRTMIRWSGLAAALVLTVSCLYGQAVWQRQAYLAELDARLTDVKPAAEIVEVKERQLAQLRHRVGRDSSALWLLARLSELAPSSGLNITRFSFIHDTRIVVEGRAETDYLVHQFTEALRDAGAEGIPWFENAQEGQLKKVREASQTLYQYEIIIPFASEEDAGFSEDEEDDA
jgi:Type IV pilus assembly protein PilM